MVRKKLLPSIVLAVTVVILATTMMILIAHGRQEDRKKDQLNEKIEQVSAYEAQIAQNSDEIARLEVQRKKCEKVAQSMVTYIFLQCSDNLYNDVYKYMTEWKAAGFFAVSTAEYPGKEGCITVEQYHEMTKNGWIPAVLISDVGELSQHLDEMELIFENCSLEKPTVLSFGRRSVAPIEIEEAYEKGYTTFFYDQQRSPNLPQSVKQEGVYFIPYFYSSCNSLVGTKIKEYVQASGSAAVGLCRATVLVSEERKELDQLLASLKTTVCDFALENGYYVSPEKYLTDTVRKNTVIQEELATINSRLATLRAENIELRQKINSIYQIKD